MQVTLNIGAAQSSTISVDNFVHNAQIFFLLGISEAENPPRLQNFIFRIRGTKSAPIDQVLETLLGQESIASLDAF